MSKKGHGFLGAVVLGVAVIVGAFVVAKCTTRVPAGYIAVQYNVSGGIEGDVLEQGWHFVSPTVKTTLYSIGLEQSYLTAEDKGDSEKDESFKTPTADGKQLTVDLEFSYRFDQDVIAQTFTRFKGKSGESVKDTFIKPTATPNTSESSFSDLSRPRQRAAGRYRPCWNTSGWWIYFSLTGCVRRWHRAGR